MAFNQDFTRNPTSSELEADKTGPNVSIHLHYFEEYEKHIILHTSREESILKSNILRTWFEKNKRSKEVEFRLIHLKEDELINLEVIQAKIMVVLMDFRDRKIDLFVTPGTPAMHTAWHLEHINSAYETRLIQTRPAKYSENGIPELIDIDFEMSGIPSAAVAREKQLSAPQINSDTFIPIKLKPVYELASHVARTDLVTTLIFGESGTGKELLARHIWSESPRKGKVFKAVNCASLPDEMLYSLLFGYLKGSYTNALKDTKGFFQQANGGTLFLDEIGDISSKMQQALLRVLQEKVVTPLGSEKEEKVDVRIIAATNQNLPELCDQGKFRWDLYYRLSVVELELPRLVDWGKRDLKRLIQFFLTKKSMDFKKPDTLNLPKEVWDSLLDYHFPGNIRELENLIARLYVISDQGIKTEHLPERVWNGSTIHPLTLQANEIKHIKRVLELKSNNLTHTAKTLGCAVNTLKAKLKKYKIQSLETSLN